MIQRCTLPLIRCDLGLRGSLLRYGMLRRLGRAAAKQGVGLLAFGLNAGEVRLVLEGTEVAIARVIKGLKVGTSRESRARGVALNWGLTQHTTVRAERLAGAVAWAHRAPVDGGAASPLSSPWSSHRDLLCFRRAAFYDASVLDGRVDPRCVHKLAGGRPLPQGWPPPVRERESLSTLLRVAASVIGVLPANRRCFALFVQLARFRGWQSLDIAHALALSTRRVRQLAHDEVKMLAVALTALADPRLSRVP